MNLAFSLLRGIIFYPLMLAIAGGLGWLILPWRQGISPGSPHMMIAVAGGGAFWVLATIVIFSTATYSN